MASYRKYHFHATEPTESATGAKAEPAIFGIDDVSISTDSTDSAAVDVPRPVEFDLPAATAHAAVKRSFHNDEAAARHFMERMWTQEEGPLFEITAPDFPAVVPDLQLRRVQECSATGTRLLHFSQTVHNVPVIGSKAVVEITGDRRLMSMDAQIGDTPGVSPIARISAADALASIATAAGVDVPALGQTAAPRLAFHGIGDKWHLVYEVRNVPVAPVRFRDAISNSDGHGLGESPRQDFLDMTYIVDASEGTLLLYYSATPWVDEFPVECTGFDEFNEPVTFFGAQSGGAFELRDPVRKIRTLDLGFANLSDAALPTTPVTAPSFDFQNLNTAAVSAHANAMRVFDFYNDVLKRDGVDDRGMELVSIVNCTYKPPESVDWKNAVWHKQRMWYGQVKNPEGKFESYSRHLDVIAHELTHGVVESTSALKYLNESGALNESFCDIFGIIVKNLNGSHPDDVAQWDWQLGRGLKSGGRPLRDLSNPAGLGYPDHMRDYKIKEWWDDSGGVHTNSNIHNKAAFHVLTSKNDGAFTFKPKEVALIYYLSLTRLSSLATFADVLATLKNVIRTFYSGRPAVIDTKVAAVVAAYQAVGIEVAE
ncbi:MAG TPA: M4 family metallopeptidase [Thermoanaerobaculia bacterium]|jgi:hypothetical protein